MSPAKKAKPRTVKKASGTAAKKSKSKQAKKASSATSKTAAKTPKAAPHKKPAAPSCKRAAKTAAPKKSATAVAKKAPQSLPYEQGKWAAAFTPRAPGETRYWLVKSEPEVFSFDDLLNAKDQTTYWDGVRNSAARNFMRDGMKLGDLVFYYHSMAEPPAIVGICEVVKEGYPDFTALDPKHEYFDAESNPDAPAWFMVDLMAVSKLNRPVTLTEIKANPELANIALIRVGRLSVVPITEGEWKIVREMGA